MIYGQVQGSGFLHCYIRDGSEKMGNLHRYGVP